MGCSCCLAKAIDPKEAQATVQQDAPEILLEEEVFHFAFKWTRDEVYFTSHRILSKDTKGLTGSRIGWKSVPYHTIKAFFTETAGTLDLDMKLTIFPSGMRAMDMSFHKDGGVDVFALQRLLNQKIFHPSSNNPVESVPRPQQMEDEMSNFMDILCSDSRAIDPKQVEAQLKANPPILDAEETVDMAFRCGRDTTALTNKRCLVIDVQGWTGKKVNYKSFLWGCIRAFDVETPGSFLDRDSVMILWTSISNSDDNKFEMDFRNSSVDLMAVQRYLSDRILGSDTAPRSEHANAMAGHVDTGGGWQAWFGDQRQLDANEADREFHQSTPILQGSESVEMAFKGKRDMMLFTTKRLVLIDPQGFTGKKKSYISIPWGTVQAFAVQTGGSWMDKDSEMMIWTDICYDIEQVDDKEVPVPGMSYIQQDFVKDKVDLPSVGRFLASKCARLGSQSSQPPPPASNLNTDINPGAMEKFLSWLGQDFRQLDPNELDRQLHGEFSFLLPEEHVQMGFVCGRDTIILTTHRAVKIDVKGFTGNRVLYLSLPYTKVRGYSVESAGSWDMDAEMSLYFKAPWFDSGGFSLDLSKGRADVVAIQQFLCAQVIGTANGESVLARELLPAVPEGQVNLFLNWLGDDHHQISREEAEQKLLSDPKILLADETVDLAFKCGRDMAVFSTKRLLLVNVKGWSGQRVEYTSVPYKYVPCFGVVGAAQHPFDLDSEVKLYTDCPATEKVKVEVRKEQGDIKAAYTFLCKKCIDEQCGKLH